MVDLVGLAVVVREERRKKKGPPPRRCRPVLVSEEDHRLEASVEDR